MFSWNKQIVFHKKYRAVQYTLIISTNLNMLFFNVPLNLINYLTKYEKMYFNYLTIQEL